MPQAQGGAQRPRTGQTEGALPVKAKPIATAVRATRRKKETFTIGFRVDGHTLSQLEKGAAAYGISVHEYARQRLLELLERRDEARVLEAAEKTQQGVEALRSDVAAALEVILLNTTKGDPARIRDWIDSHLRGAAGEALAEEEGTMSARPRAVGEG